MFNIKDYNQRINPIGIGSPFGRNTNECLLYGNDTLFACKTSCMNNSLLVGVVVARYKANIIISSFTAGNPHFRPACPYYRSAVYVTFLKYIFFKTSGVKSSEDFPAVFWREQVIF